MKGDIAFAGFVLTAEEWRQLDALSRAQLIAVATRRTDPWFTEAKPRPCVDDQWVELEPDPD